MVEATHLTEDIHPLAFTAHNRLFGILEGLDDESCEKYQKIFTDKDIKEKMYCNTIYLAINNITKETISIDLQKHFKYENGIIIYDKGIGKPVYYHLFKYLYRKDMNGDIEQVKWNGLNIIRDIEYFFLVKNITEAVMVRPECIANLLKSKSFTAYIQDTDKKHILKERKMDKPTYCAIINILIREHLFNETINTITKNLHKTFTFNQNDSIDTSLLPVSEGYNIAYWRTNDAFNKLYEVYHDWHKKQIDEKDYLEDIKSNINKEFAVIQEMQYNLEKELNNMSNERELSENAKQKKEMIGQQIECNNLTKQKYDEYLKTAEGCMIRDSCVRVVMCEADTLEEKNTALKRENAELRQQLQKIQGDLGVYIEDELGKTRGQLLETQGELGETQGALGKTRGQLLETQDALGKTQGELRRTQDALRETQDALRKTEGELGRTQGELGVYREDMTQLQKAYVYLQKAYNNLQKQKEQGENNAQEIRNRLIKNMAEKETLRNRNKQLENETEQLRQYVFKLNAQQAPTATHQIIGLQPGEERKM